MQKETLRVALCSPDKNVIPSTFIHAHKTLLSGKISYFYDGWCPTKLEGKGKLFTILEAIWFVFRNKILGNKLNYKQQALKRSFQRINPDVCFVEYGISGAKILPICEELGIPLVVIFHGADAHEKLVLDEFRNEYKRLFEYSDSVVVVSKFMKDHLISLGCPVGKLVWTPCAPKDDFSKVINNPQPYQLLAVGRFTEKKSPQTSIRAFAEVLKKFPKAILYFGGEGELLPICKQLAYDLKIQNSVFFLGQISPAQLINYLSSTFAFIQHSVTAKNGDMEGTPVAILEASLAGVPVVSTLHAGIPDIIQNGINGFLVKEYDVHGMANAIIQLFEDPERARMMGMNGKDIILKNFSMRHHIDTLNLAIHQAAKISILNGNN